MTASRATPRSSTKSGRSTLHARKQPSRADGATEQPALITDMSLSRMGHDSGERQNLIRELAYQYAESRGFAPGHDLEDWLAAEAEVDARLIGESRAY